MMKWISVRIEIEYWRTFVTVAMYASEGAKFDKTGVGVLYIK